MLQAVPEPAVTLSDIDLHPFLGRHVLTSTAFGERLADAQARFRAAIARRSDEYAAATKKDLGAFEWRARAASSGKRFTNHMLGRAIDIDAATNPIFKASSAQAADEPGGRPA
jgi:hypothetical protein